MATPLFSDDVLGSAISTFQRSWKPPLLLTKVVCQSTENFEELHEPGVIGNGALMKYTGRLVTHDRRFREVDLKRPVSPLATD
jgi:hypothetical protein